MQTTTSIGRRCRCGNAHSRAILIAQRPLSGSDPNKKIEKINKPSGETGMREENAFDKRLVDRQVDPRRGPRGWRRPPGPTSPHTRAAMPRRRTKAAKAPRIHLFPFRTEKLSSAAPMVLRKRESRQPPPYQRQGRQRPNSRRRLF